MHSRAADALAGWPRPTGKFSARELRWLLVLALFMVLVGLVLIDDFGQSTDEYGDFQYAEDALRAYTGSAGFMDHGNRHFYGPIHLEFAFLLGELAESLDLSRTALEGRHFANYLTFVMGTISFYFLSRRFLRPSGSALSALLFASQPLLFGHAFINQKDAPFMSWFVLSVTAGLYAIDKLGSRVPTATSASTWSVAVADYQRLSRSRRIALGLTALLFLGALLDFLATGFVLRLGEAHLTDAYNGIAWPPIQRVFGLVAQDAYKTPLDQYIGKLRLIYGWSRVLVAVGLLGSLYWLTTRNLPGLANRLIERTPGSILGLTLAGMALGVTTGIRVAAALAGLLVSYRLVRLRRWESMFPLLLYWGVAAGISYLAWPLLWRDTLTGLWQAARFMSDFPASRSVLYFGQEYSSRALPWHLFPVFVGIQLTEPAVLGIPIGLLVLLAAARKAGLGKTELDVLLLWLLIPAAGAMVLRRPIYGNIRQLLFSLPPLLLVSAVGLNYLSTLSTNRFLKGLVVAACLVPGPLGIAYSHPYEYSFYNSFVGGFSGAFGRFQVDNWCTSNKKAMEYVNNLAPPNARIGVQHALEAARAFAREDLMVFDLHAGAPDSDFVIICSGLVVPDSAFPAYRTVFEVRHRGAVLAAVKRRED